MTTTNPATTYDASAEGCARPGYVGAENHAPAPTPAPESPPPCEAAPKAARNLGGAPKGNVSNLKTGHRGSKMPAKCKHEEGIVAGIVNRVLAELAAKTGPGPLTAAQENLIAQIRRAAERDRVAAKVLRDLKDLKGGDLTHAQQVEQREIQAASLRVIETCLGKLGLGGASTASADPWAMILNQPTTPPASGASPPNATGKAPGHLPVESSQDTKQDAGTLPSFSASPRIDATPVEADELLDMATNRSDPQ